MNFKSLFFFFAFSMVISLFGCSSDSNESTPSETQNIPQEQAAEKKLNLAENQGNIDDNGAKTMKALEQPDEMKKMLEGVLELSKKNLAETRMSLAKEEEAMKMQLSEDAFAKMQAENREKIKGLEEGLEEIIKDLEGVR